MSTNIEHSEENEAEIERLKLLAKKNLLPFLKPNDESVIKENLAAIKRMPEAEQKRLRDFFLRQLQQRAKIWFHEGIKARLEELEKIPVKKRIEYYKKEVKAITEAIQIWEMTGVFEIDSDGEKRRYSGPNVPSDDYKHLLRIFKSKLEELHTDTGNADKNKNSSKATSDELKDVTRVLINSYKAHVKIEPLKLKNDWEKENKLRCYHIQRLITKGQRQIKPSEIEEAIEKLEEFPTAKEFALKQLALINQK